jgi:hypothetical protein
MRSEWRVRLRPPTREMSPWLENRQALVSGSGKLSRGCGFLWDLASWAGIELEMSEQETWGGLVLQVLDCVAKEIGSPGWWEERAVHSQGE